MKDAKKIDLFTPITLGACKLKNRMVMAPMTRNRASRDGIPQTLNVLYYEQRATAGLIITEGSPISPQGIGYPFTPGIYTEAQIVGWKAVTDAVHKKGGHIFLQLWHTGRISHPSLQIREILPVAPSAIKAAGDAITYEGMQAFVTPQALTPKEITEIVDDFKQAAKNALAAGFDGVEIHGANGYLIDQFLRDGSNQRQDLYGGSIENRFRFLSKVIEAVCEVCGHDRVGLRLSPSNAFNDMSDSHPEKLFSEIVSRLNSYPLAYLHVVEGIIHSPDASEPTFDVKKLRKIYEGLYIANGGYNKKRGSVCLKNGEADLISFGELFLSNPDLPTRFAKNTPLNAPDQKTYYGGDDKGYTDYPFLEMSDRENEMDAH